MTEGNRFVLEFYLNCVTTLNIESGILRDLINELKYKGYEKMLFMKKLEMIRTAYQNVSIKKNERDNKKKGKGNKNGYFYNPERTVNNG